MNDHQNFSISQDAWTRAPPHTHICTICTLYITGCMRNVTDFFNISSTNLSLFLIHFFMPCICNTRFRALPKMFTHNAFCELENAHNKLLIFLFRYWEKLWKHKQWVYGFSYTHLLNNWNNKLFVHQKRLNCYCLTIGLIYFL